MAHQLLSGLEILFFLPDTRRESFNQREVPLHKADCLLGSLLCNAPTIPVHSFPYFVSSDTLIDHFVFGFQELTSFVFQPSQVISSRVLLKAVTKFSIL